MLLRRMSSSAYNHAKRIEEIFPLYIEISRQTKEREVQYD